MRLLIPSGLAVLALSLAACGPGKLSHWPNSRTMRVSQCTPIEQATPGSEDIVVAGRYAFISSDPSRSDKRRSGAIYAYDLEGRGPATLARDTTPAHPYRPHGMGLFTGPDRKQLLFVVTHTGDREAIEIFSVDGPRLHFVEAIRDTAKARSLIRGNDVVPVGPRSFYVTNSQASPSSLGSKIEIAFSRPRAYLLFYDGQKFTRAAEGLAFANGVNVGADQLVYVTGSRSQDLRVYQREADGSHRPLQTIPLKSGADNVEVDSSGGVWVASHPSAWAFNRYRSGASDRSTSEVLYFPRIGDTLRMPERLVPDSALRPATSVAVRLGNRMLLGSVADYALDCRFAGPLPR